MNFIDPDDEVDHPSYVIFFLDNAWCALAMSIISLYFFLYVSIPSVLWYFSFAPRKVFIPALTIFSYCSLVKSVLLLR